MAQPDPAGCLVDEVDGLVRQVAVGDVADGQIDGGLHRVIRDGHLVMLLVPVTDAEQDLHGLLERGLLDHDRLESPLQGSVTLDVLAVLVEGRGADALEFPAGQRRLEDVRGVDGAFRGAGADERVQLVDEQDRVAGAA